MENKPNQNGGPQKEQAWHALTTEDVLRHLEVQNDGLNNEQAARRLARYGQNQLEEAPRPTFWHMLWEQLNNFVVILLIVASSRFALCWAITWKLPPSWRLWS